jgi:hypothetical protein
MPAPGLDVEPTRVGGRAGRGAALPIAVLIAAFVLVAVAKPWTPDADAQPAITSRTEAPSLDAAVTAPLVAEAVEDDGATSPADPFASSSGWDAVSSVGRMLAAHGGTWGVGTGSWNGVLPEWVDWVRVPARPARAPRPGPNLAAAACRDGQLLGEPRIVVLTGPAETLDDAAVTVWQLRRTPFQVADDLHVDRSLDSPGVAFLVLTSGRAWRDGAYRFIAEPRAGSPVALDVCIGTVPGAGRVVPAFRRR